MDALLVIAGIAINTLLVVGIAYLARKYVLLKTSLPDTIALLPEDIRRLLEGVAKFASEFVEKMDENGQLQPLLDDLKSKSETKLNLAIDIASKRLEDLFKENGFNLDINEEQIKQAIQKYVWDNPDIFPSSRG